MAFPRTLFVFASAFVGSPSSRRFYAEVERRQGTDLMCLDILQAPQNVLLEAAAWADYIAIDSMAFAGRDWIGDPSRYIDYGRDFDRVRLVETLDALVASGRMLALIAADYDLHSGMPGGLTTDELRAFSTLAWGYVEEPPPWNVINSPAYKDYWVTEGETRLDTWTKVRQAIPRQVEFVHGVDKSEFMGHRVGRWDACVPGQQYRTRKLAAKSAEKQGLSVAPYASRDWLLVNAGRGLNLVSPRSAASGIFGTLARARYVNMGRFINRSTVSFTCGSFLKYTVRKYFEIPACGSALICYPSSNLERLGFVDGINFLSCTPEGFGEIAHEAMKVRGRTDRLRAAASQLVLALHTNETRVTDVLRCLTLAAKSELKGAKYADGVLQPW